jgi:hypothetical protein
MVAKCLTLLDDTLETLNFLLYGGMILALACYKGTGALGLMNIILWLLLWEGFTWHPTEASCLYTSC